MEEDLEKFLVEQRERVAQDKVTLLLQERPYMEIRRKPMRGDDLKENMTLPLRRMMDNKDCVSLSLPLGEEYERKKHKLQQELRQDYRRYMIQKQCDGDTEDSTAHKLPPKVKDAATLTAPLSQPHIDVGLEGCVCVCESVCVCTSHPYTPHRGPRSQGCVCVGDPQPHTHCIGVESETHMCVCERVCVCGKVCVCHTALGLEGSNGTEPQFNTRRQHKERARVTNHSEGFQPVAKGGKGMGYTVGWSNAQLRRTEHDRELHQQMTRERGLDVRTSCRQWGKQQGLCTYRRGDELHDLPEGEGEWTPPQELQLAFQSHHRNYRDGVSGLREFSSVKNRSIKDADISYREALRQQIAERALCRRAEREQRREQEAREQAEFRTQQPWGRGGGGAPLRDSTGNLITDLNHMHRLNEEAYMNASKLQRTPGVPRPQSSQLAYLFSEPPTSNQQLEQDKYKAYLKQQIEEKRRRKAEERERERQQDEKEEKRLAEQRERIQREYQEEQERRRRKELEQKLLNEELMLLAEERRKEAQRRKREEEEKEHAALRKQQETHTYMHQVQRIPSPPIPTLQRKNTHHYSPRLATEEIPLGLPSPPVPARKNQMRSAEHRQSILSELCVLRRRLRSEQQKLEGQLLQEWETHSPPLHRHKADVFDMARLRVQASVRRPLPRSCEVPPTRERDAQTDLQAAHRRQLRTSSPRETDDLLSPPVPSTSQQPRRSGTEDGVGGSLLESDSAFIAHTGMLPVPPEERRGVPLSARERCRIKKQNNIWPLLADSPPEQNFSVRLRN